MSNLSPDTPVPYPASPQTVVYIFLALLSCLLTIPPLILQMRARNLSLIILFLCFLIQNFLNFLNAVVWHNDDIVHWWHGAILCNIEMKLQYGTYQAILGAPSCILRYLSLTLDTEHITMAQSKRQKLVQLSFEIILCIVFPVTVMCLQYLVQARRYAITALVGCQFELTKSRLGFAIIQPWRLIACTIGCFYGTITIYRLCLYRRQISSLLGSQQAKLSHSRFTRLFILSIMLSLGSTTVVCLSMTPLASWVSEDSSNRDNSEVEDSPTILMFHAFGTVPFAAWSQIATGFLVIFMLGTGQDANKVYKSWMTKLTSSKALSWLRSLRMARGPAGEDSPPSRNQPVQRNSITSRVRSVDSELEGPYLSRWIANEAIQGSY